MFTRVAWRVAISLPVWKHMYSLCGIRTLQSWVRTRPVHSYVRLPAPWRTGTIKGALRRRLPRRYVK